jgi:PAS domain S-box-containing protein
MSARARLCPKEVAVLAVLLVISLAVSVAIWRGVAVRQEMVMRAEFERRGDQAVHGLTARLELYQAVLRTAAGYWAKHPASGIDEWRALVQASEIPASHPGAQGLAYAVAVPDAELDRFTADIRARLWPGFAVRQPATGVSPHAIVTHAEPLARLDKLLGYDFAVDPVRRQAAELARDSGRLAMSSPLTLIAGGDSGRDVVLVQPVFRPDMPADSVDQRRQAIQGWLLLGLHVNAVLASLQQQIDDPSFDIAILAGNDGTAVYGHTHASDDAQFVTARQVDFAGQHWLIKMHRHLPPGSAWFSGIALVVLAVSLALSVAVTVAAALLLISREQSRQLAHHAMTELSRAEVALAAVTRSVPGVVYRWLEGRTDGAFQFVAPQAGILFGIPAAALIEDWRRLPFLPEDMERWHTSLTEAARTALPWELEGRYHDQDGAVRWWKATATPSPGADGVAFDGIIVDITALKEAEQVLAERERSYREMFERSNAVMVLADPLSGRVVDVNPAAQAYYGYAAEQMRGMDIHTISLAEDGRWRELADAASKGQAEFYTSRHRLASGEVRDVEVNTGPVSVLGRMYVLGIVHDVTDRQNLQAELEEKSSKLAATNAELEQFSYVASHDLQEPLRTIASFLHLLQRRYEGRLDAEANEFIAFAVDASARLQSMIRDLLDYSRVGTRGGEFVPTDMNKELATARASLAGAIEEAGAEIIGDPLPFVVADRMQMQSLLQNLIGNAIKYRRPDRPPRIHISAEEDEARWVFRICDNGIGIAPQYFDRIFQVFQRLHSREKFGGTGIGLALCRKIVDRHGGSIWVESQPGQGSTFLFSIPKR